MKDFPALLEPLKARYLDTVPGFGHLEDVLVDPRLTTQDKRELLASWASDANAVPHLPMLRQLPDGSIVKLEEILRALQTLDHGNTEGEDRPHKPETDRRLRWRQSFARRRGSALRIWVRKNRGPDDDDPPPCPAYALVGPRNGGGATGALVDAVFA